VSDTFKFLIVTFINLLEVTEVLVVVVVVVAVFVVIAVVVVVDVTTVVVAGVVVIVFGSATVTVDFSLVKNTRQRTAVVIARSKITKTDKKQQQGEHI
jgi:hypothetical protein